MTSDDPEPARAPSCRCLDTSRRGRGVFTLRRFRRGDKVLEFGGRRIPAAEIADYTHCLEIAPGWFLGPSGGPDDYVNHSCEPNCAVYAEDDALVLRALRRIAAGEEVTFDYSTVMVTDPTTFPCGCGSPRCRGRVVPFRALPTSVQRRQIRRGIVPDFVVASADVAPIPHRPRGLRRRRRFEPLEKAHRATR